jgi:hypothetical protein
VTLEQIISALNASTPFEGSTYEKSAFDVYAAGLNSQHPGYDSLDDALSDWRMEYESDIADLARDIATTSEPGLWLTKEIG